MYNDCMLRHSFIYILINVSIKIYAIEFECINPHECMKISASRMENCWAHPTQFCVLYLKYIDI